MKQEYCSWLLLSVLLHVLVITSVILDEFVLQSTSLILLSSFRFILPHSSSFFLILPHTSSFFLILPHSSSFFLILPLIFLSFIYPFILLILIPTKSYLLILNLNHPINTKLYSISSYLFHFFYSFFHWTCDLFSFFFYQESNIHIFMYPCIHVSI